MLCNVYKKSSPDCFIRSTTWGNQTLWTGDLVRSNIYHPLTIQVRIPGRQEQEQRLFQRLVPLIINRLVTTPYHRQPLRSRSKKSARLGHAPYREKEPERIAGRTKTKAGRLLAHTATYAFTVSSSGWPGGTTIARPPCHRGHGYRSLRARFTPTTLIYCRKKTRGPPWHRGGYHNRIYFTGCPAEPGTVREPLAIRCFIDGIEWNRIFGLGGYWKLF